MNPIRLIQTFASTMTSAATLICLSACFCRGATITEDFSASPAQAGWLKFGNESLFVWDGSNAVLRVNWDSAQTNSYFYLPLGRTLNRLDDFEASFDIRLDDTATGTTSGKPYSFQLAVCLFDVEQAKRTNFFVGSGTSAISGPRSSIEFNYFPAYEDPVYGDITSTFALITVPTNTNPFLYDHDFPRDLDPGVWHRVTLRYTATNETVTMSKTRNGAAYGTVQSIALSSGFGDFSINAFSLSSYSDKVGLGSVNAHGQIDNVQIIIPDPPISSIQLTFTSGPAVHFQSQTGWFYALERCSSLGEWMLISGPLPGTGSEITITDTNPPVEQAFYRIRVDRP